VNVRPSSSSVINSPSIHRSTCPFLHQWSETYPGEYSTIRTRTSPNCWVRQNTLPSSATFSIASISDQSVSTNAGSTIFMKCRLIPHRRWRSCANQARPQRTTAMTMRSQGTSQHVSSLASLMPIPPEKHCPMLRPFAKRMSTLIEPWSPYLPSPNERNSHQPDLNQGSGEADDHAAAVWCGFADLFYVDGAVV
jgi:hypothetical protein